MIGINVNETLVLSANSLINSNNSNWQIVGNNLFHDSSVPSFIEKEYDFLEDGKKYKITYFATHDSCDYNVILGSTEGIIRNVSSPIEGWSEDFIFTGTDKKLKFWSNGKVTINSIKIELYDILVQDIIVNIGDKDIIENKSFTLSYSPVGKQYISYHSYFPNNYINHPKSLLVKNNDSQLMEANKGDYGKYFDEDIKPFIIENIFSDEPLSTKVFDNITVNLKSELNKVPTNKFFDKLILNTEYQCSGEIVLNTTNLTKKERDWCINKFTDITNNSNNSLFTSEWDNIKNDFPIDKVVNSDKIDNSKPWYQRGRFRDKFITVRFIENNLENQKIICNFVSTIYRTSQR